MLEGESFEVVLMDIQIHGLKDGVDAADEIRRHLDVPAVAA